MTDLLPPLKDIILEYARPQIIGANIDNSKLTILNLETGTILYHKDFNKDNYPGKINLTVYFFPYLSKVYIRKRKGLISKIFILSLLDNSIQDIKFKEIQGKEETYFDPRLKSKRYLYDRYQFKKIDMTNGIITDIKIDYSLAKNIPNLLPIKVDEKKITDIEIINVSMEDSIILLKEGKIYYLGTEGELFLIAENIDLNGILNEKYFFCNLFMEDNKNINNHENNKIYRYDIKGKILEKIAMTANPTEFYKNNFIAKVVENDNYKFYLIDQDSLIGALIYEYKGPIESIRKTKSSYGSVFNIRIIGRGGKAIILSDDGFRLVEYTEGNYQDIMII